MLYSKPVREGSHAIGVYSDFGGDQLKVKHDYADRVTTLAVKYGEQGGRGYNNTMFIGIRVKGAKGAEVLKYDGTEFLSLGHDDFEVVFNFKQSPEVKGTKLFRCLKHQIF